MSPGQYIDTNGKYTVGRLLELVAIPSVNLLESTTGKRCRSSSSGVREPACPRPYTGSPHRIVRAAGVDPAFPRYNLIARWEVGAERTPSTSTHTMMSFRHRVPEIRWGLRGPVSKRGGCTAWGRRHERFHRGLAGRGGGAQACGQSPAFNIECSLTADESGGALGVGHIVSEGPGQGRLRPWFVKGPPERE